MGYLTHLKRTAHCPSCRWFIKRDSNDDIKEVKLVYKPSEYRQTSNARKLYTQKGLISILEAEKNKKNNEISRT
ncbi:MAG: hypothetical protein GOVbin1709_28 [Prokaryotic dsDNA virus sp.]|nr:MAG: hypothetical protein GOVbin1709_28 [Prokaryotic dsDNA virus sp.]|tara:strand:+ start:3718 stop:3939 length:222 start_codon:yes stop_codon:yes gene_type:complete